MWPRTCYLSACLWGFRRDTTEHPLGRKWFLTFIPTGTINFRSGLLLVSLLNRFSLKFLSLCWFLSLSILMKFLSIPNSGSTLNSYYYYCVSFPIKQIFNNFLFPSVDIERVSTLHFKNTPHCSCISSFLPRNALHSHFLPWILPSWIYNAFVTILDKVSAVSTTCQIFFFVFAQVFSALQFLVGNFPKYPFPFTQMIFWAPGAIF